MNGYRLEDTGGGGTFPLCPGETVIGRGPFLGVADKRVSRNHAILEVVNDKLRIKPIHINPCFYQASHKSKFVPLERNEWHWLHPGDCFSLLPDQYAFRILAEYSSQEATLRNSQALDDSQSSATNSGTKAEVEEPTCSGSSKLTSSVPSGKCEMTKDGTFSNISVTVRQNVDVEQPRPAQRKRILPDWMLPSDLPIESLPVPVIKAGKKKRCVAVNRTRETDVSKKEAHAVKSRDDSEHGCIMKEEAAAQLQVLPGTSSNIASAADLGNSNRCVLDSVENDMEIDDHTPELSPHAELHNKNGPSESVVTKHITRSPGNDDLSQRTGSPTEAPQTLKHRPCCIYAAQCYRKNPSHFQEYSHPGDSDYRIAESGESQVDNDDRPECPYGIDCYRKNPQHKLEYKHTKPPGRRLRKRVTKKAKSADSENDGEPNEYDLDDSFIDDDEEEEEDFTDEDSDWMPDSEEKDSEDVKTLLKEAKHFVKGKR